MYVGGFHVGDFLWTGTKRWGLDWRFHYRAGGFPELTLAFASQECHIPSLPLLWRQLLQRDFPRWSQQRDKGPNGAALYKFHGRLCARRWTQQPPIVFQCCECL